jgi:hypothetical protein
MQEKTKGFHFLRENSVQKGGKIWAFKIRFRFAYNKNMLEVDLLSKIICIKGL